MQVILLERVEKLGQMGDVVAVRPGYARNFLLPQHKAMRATKENLAQFEARRAQLEAENLKRREEAEKVAAKADGLTVRLIRAASETGQLYGSVNTRDLAEAVTEAGVRIERRQVHLDRPIKTTGMIPVTIVLHPEVSMTVMANVARSTDEADMQARGIDPNREIDDDEEDESLSLWDVEGASEAADAATEESEPASFAPDDESR